MYRLCERHYPFLNQPLQQQAVQQGIQPPAPGIQPPIPQPVMQQSTPAVYDDGQVLRRLLAIEDKLNNLNGLLDEFNILMKKLVKKIDNKNNLFLDIGAHHGTVTKLILDNTQNLNVMCYEPHPG